MMKAILLSIAITVTQVNNATPVSTYLKKNDSDTSSLKNATLPSMKDMLQDIMGVLGLEDEITLKQANVLNIEASISHQKRYILYNADYVSRLNSLTKDKWAVMALIAHEVGHHLNGHTIKRGGSSPDLELQADEFAGFILCRLGATLEEAQELMYCIANTTASHTHPARSARLQAIEKGWNKAMKTRPADPVHKN